MMWPILLTLLMQIFEKNTSQKSYKDRNLILAALKLIELISLKQIDEFYLHQWMFVCDCKELVIVFHIV